jgi:serine protease
MTVTVRRHPHPSFRLIALSTVASLALCLMAAPTVVAAPSTVPGEIVVGYDPGVPAAIQDGIANSIGTTPGEQVSPSSQVVHVQPGESVTDAIARLKRTDGVAFAVRNRIARAAAEDSWVPNDIGRVGRPAGGWLTSQWNFSTASGVGAIPAWNNLRRAGYPGGRGVKIAVIDSGVAYRNWGRYKRSPDFAGTRFSDPCDFLARHAPKSCVPGQKKYRPATPPVDRFGHGTHVAGTIAEATNNRIHMTGLAWGATIMPLRVLDSQGNGDSADIAQAIRWASDHSAKIVNLSIEFDPGTTAGDIPEIISAVNYATSRGTLVVAAAGNDGRSEVSYPARTPNAFAVGAMTEHGCLAEYSNYGTGLDIVAPGGGLDRRIPTDPNCKIDSTGNRDIVQLGLRRGRNGSALIPYQFSIEAEDGTSMATPHVSAAAALVVASRRLGRFPKPSLLKQHLKDGRLVAPFARSIATPRGYYLVESAGAQQGDAARDFATWIRREAGKASPAKS